MELGTCWLDAQTGKDFRWFSLDINYALFISSAQQNSVESDEPSNVRTARPTHVPPQISDDLSCNSLAQKIHVPWTSFLAYNDRHLPYVDLVFFFFSRKKGRTVGEHGHGRSNNLFKTYTTGFTGGNLGRSRGFFSALRGGTRSHTTTHAQHMHAYVSTSRSTRLE